MDNLLARYIIRPYSMMCTYYLLLCGVVVCRRGALRVSHATCNRHVSYTAQPPLYLKTKTLEVILNGLLHKFIDAKTNH